MQSNMTTLFTYSCAFCRIIAGISAHNSIEVLFFTPPPLFSFLFLGAVGFSPLLVLRPAPESWIMFVPQPLLVAPSPVAGTGSSQRAAADLQTGFVHNIRTVPPSLQRIAPSRFWSASTAACPKRRFFIILRAENNHGRCLKSTRSPQRWRMGYPFHQCCSFPTSFATENERLNCLMYASELWVNPSEAADLQMTQAVWHHCSSAAQSKAERRSARERKEIYYLLEKKTKQFPKQETLFLLLIPNRLNNPARVSPSCFLFIAFTH